MDYFKIILDNLLPLIVLVIIPIAIFYVNKWLKGKATQDQIDAIDRAVYIAVGAGEEAGHKALKVDKKPLSSVEKMDVAMKAFVFETRELGIPELIVERAKLLIESALNGNRPITPTLPVDITDKK